MRSSSRRPTKPTWSVTEPTKAFLTEPPSPHAPQIRRASQLEPQRSDGPPLTTVSFESERHEPMLPLLMPVKQSHGQSGGGVYFALTWTSERHFPTGGRHDF